MKILKKSLLVVAVLFSMVALVSWNHLRNSTRDVGTSQYLEKNSQEYSDAELNVFTAEDYEFKFSPESEQMAPPAEDVLVQKIPGDNTHLLMMAFYSKENYSGQFVTIKNGTRFVFRDDGKGYDKKAGDGLYTAKVTANVNEFERQALKMSAQMNKIDYKPVRFDHRSRINDPDADESFDWQSWEKGEPVSVSGLTNALSDIEFSGNGGIANWVRRASTLSELILF